MFRLVDASTAEHLETARSLFVEYGDSLHLNLCFQNFDSELRSLPGAYTPPKGRLLLAITPEDEVAGCIAMRPLPGGTAEMKRLYVRPGFRRSGLGRMLAEAVIEAARTEGYPALRLDTLPSMQAAIAMYERLGFRDIPPYYENPVAGARFLELALRP